MTTKVTDFKSSQSPDSGSNLMPRRALLTGSLGLAGGALAAAGLSPLTTRAEGFMPPEVPQWTKSLGPGVLTQPYGQPSKFESHVQRRTVEWLTADRIASISFTPLADLKGIITPSGVM